MALIKATMYSDAYERMRSEASELRETNDCSVKAVAIACGIDYASAHRVLASCGRKNGKGAYTHQINEAIKVLGKMFEFVNERHFIDRYPGAHSKLSNVTTHHPARFRDVWCDGHTYLLYTKRHVLAVVNGVNHDWTVNKSMRVVSVYRITDY